MRKIYYITRSFPKILNSGGGSQMRAKTVELLRKNNLDVWVVAPYYGEKTIKVDDKEKQILIPLTYNLKTAQHFESIGLLEDYLDKWIRLALSELKNIIKKEDVIFATSGGELGTLKLASKLKAKINCGFIANFRDPLLLSTINNKKVYHPASRFKIANRDRFEKKYLDNADRIITSSKTYRNVLLNKHPEWTGKIFNNYFGYISNVNLEDKVNQSLPLKIVYGGNMGKIQSPEILAQAVEGMKDVNAQFIGDYSKNINLQKYKDNVTLTRFLPYKDYNNLLTKDAQVGFSSLTGAFSQVCVPSKIYEYINLGLPILGVFDKGDAMNIINNNGYGIACFNDMNEIKAAIERLKSPNFRASCKKNILRDKKNWSMENRIKEVISLINMI